MTTPTIPTPAPRIRWEPTKHGGWTGHVGMLETWAFQIFKTGLGYAGWSLSSTFPGAFGESRMSDDSDELKAQAEHWLEEFVSSLGAIFEPEPATARKSRAWHADWAEVDRDPDGNAILRHKPTGGRYKILPAEEC